ncbi:MAG TPA: CPBP family glutamic-type intramembrane protease [Anaerolineales bacterium]|nr:CPBP family glutamic-type intramembrane protease [Anaerolineales bacterium]
MFKNIFQVSSKWLTPVLPYLAVGSGVFWFRNAWAALLGFHLAILLSLLFVGARFPIKALFKSNHIHWLVLSVVLCGSAGIFLYFFWSSFGIASDISAHIVTLGLDSANWRAFIAYFSLVNPFMEEYFWRGYLGSATRYIHISDFAYAGFHALILVGNMPLSSIIYGLIALVLAGWFWRQVAREDGGLLAPVLGHMAADFTILMTVYRMSL